MWSLKWISLQNKFTASLNHLIYLKYKLNTFTLSKYIKVPKLLSILKFVDITFSLL
jgi:hypothetical protein